jgi:hypothetical protein
MLKSGHNSDKIMYCATHECSATFMYGFILSYVFDRFGKCYKSMLL